MTGPAADTATAVAFGDRPPPRRMRLASFKPMVKGALRGFATIELPIGLKITDCPLLSSNGKAWATFPGRPQIGPDGRQIEAAGRKQFTAILAWPDRDTADRWSGAVVDLVRQQYPGALDDEGEP